MVCFIVALQRMLIVIVNREIVLSVSPDLAEVQDITLSWPARSAAITANILELALSVALVSNLSKS